MNNTFVMIFAAALTSYLLRVLPLTLIRKPIRSRFARSFLYYVPYVTLTVMTFPAILTATGSVYAGCAALAAAVVLAAWGKGLITVSLAACAAAFLVGMLV